MTFQLSKNELLNKVLWLIVFLILTAVVFFFVKKQEFKRAQTNGQNVVIQADQKIVEETPRYKIDITQPVVPNDDAIAEYIRSAVTSFKDYLAGQEIQPDMQYELIGDYKKVSSQKLGTTTYIVTIYEFTGGAHGNTALTTFTFNKEEKLLAIDEILNSDNFWKVSQKFGEKLVIPKLKTQLGEVYNEEMIQAGLFGKFSGHTDGFNPVFPYLNFKISDEGITFIFGQYQVAPYAAGMPEVFVSWNELKPYLNPNFAVPLD